MHKTTTSNPADIFRLNTMDTADVANKVVLVRVDLNVPMVRGKVSDMTRIRAIVPTLRELADKKARVVVLSHFDRPKGKFVPAMSLAPLVDVVGEALNELDGAPASKTNLHLGALASDDYDTDSRPSGLRYPVKFAVDCVGSPAKEGVAALQPGEILILENVRFHPGEESGDEAFTKELASLGELFVNDAFSASHRAHASVSGIAAYLPAYAGRLLQQEVEAFEQLLGNPKRPLAAVVGGAKVSTKLEILDNLLCKVDYLIIGGAMANTFLAAEGKQIGTSLVERDLIPTAKQIAAHAKESGCKLILPVDFVVTEAFAPSAPCRIVSADAIPDGMMQLDVGPDTVGKLRAVLQECQSVVWNGPLGAFETRPFDVSTISLAREVAGRTRAGKLFSLAGGGDTISALAHAGLAAEFSYLSTAGGAFLEWLQGKTLPGVAVLAKAA